MNLQKEKISFVLVGSLSFMDKTIEKVREEEWGLTKNEIYEPHITLFEAPLGNLFTLHQNK